jgi:hypothetical protein
MQDLLVLQTLAGTVQGFGLSQNSSQIVSIITLRTDTLTIRCRVLRQDKTLSILINF